MHFEKKFVGVENNEVYMTLESWVNRHTENTDDLVLQMDIEGDEYDVLMNVPMATLKKFRILVIEFHALQSLSDPFGFRIINFTFRKLLEDFVIVHIHPNNVFKPVKVGSFMVPPIMEYTFLRKDRFRHLELTTKFPHELDQTNIQGKPDFDLPSCWYASQKSLNGK